MRTRLTSPLTVLVAATLLLSGCGGEDAGRPGEIAGADVDKGAQSVAPSPAVDDGIVRPEIRLPADVKNTFEGAVTTDPVKKAVLADNERRLGTIAQAITSGDTKTSGMGFYSAGMALESASAYVKGGLDKGLTITGTARFYDRVVTVHNARSASLSYCADETRVFVKERGTKKPKKDPVTRRSYVFYETELVKNKKGVWQTTSVESARGSTRCLP
ncbi:hypothetical protein IPZ68_38730 [Streptomyces arenae]|nr:hypothetical protein [Streptomyces arenae]